VQCISSIHSILHTDFFQLFFLFILVLVHLYCHIFVLDRVWNWQPLLVWYQVYYKLLVWCWYICLFRNEIPKRNSLPSSTYILCFVLLSDVWHKIIHKRSGRRKEKKKEIFTGNVLKWSGVYICNLCWCGVSLVMTNMSL
jgi:hypothetical protein